MSQELAPRPKALILVPHDPCLDPRVGWVAESLSAQFDVCEVGISESDASTLEPRFELLPGGRSRICVARTFHDDNRSELLRDGSLRLSAETGALHYLLFLSENPRRAGLEDADPGSNSGSRDRFRSLAWYIYNTNMALLHAAQLLGGADIVVACDFEALPASVILGKSLSIPIVYDSHEFWPYSFVGWADWEVRLWLAFDRYYAACADFRMTVSSTLARFMSDRYKLNFGSIPNAVPLADGLGIQRTDVDRDEVVFLYQGRFAPERGIEQLIDAWPLTDAPCVLHLRGPESSFRDAAIERARVTGLLGSRIHFPASVSENELVKEAAKADVGLVSYEPTSPNNRYCCPNKLSQYMAAGLPILSNKLDYVEEQIKAAECGEVVSFADRHLLSASVNGLARNGKRRREMGKNSRAYFETCFNWDRQSGEVIQHIASLVCMRKTRPPGFDFSWTKGDRGFPQGVLDNLYEPFMALIKIYDKELSRLCKSYTQWLPTLTGSVRERSPEDAKAEIGTLEDLLIDLAETNRVAASLVTEMAQLPDYASQMEEVRRAKLLTETASDTSRVFSRQIEIAELMRRERVVANEVSATMRRLVTFERETEAVLHDFDRAREMLLSQHSIPSAAYEDLSEIARPDAGLLAASLEREEHEFSRVWSDFVQGLWRTERATGVERGNFVNDLIDKRHRRAVAVSRDLETYSEKVKVRFDQCRHRAEIARLAAIVDRATAWFSIRVRVSRLIWTRQLKALLCVPAELRDLRARRLQIGEEVLAVEAEHIESMKRISEASDEAKTGLERAFLSELEARMAELYGIASRLESLKGRSF